MLVIYWPSSLHPNFIPRPIAQKAFLYIRVRFFVSPALAGEQEFRNQREFNRLDDSGSLSLEFACARWLNHSMPQWFFSIVPER